MVAHFKHFIFVSNNQSCPIAFGSSSTWNLKKTSPSAPNHHPMNPSQVWNHIWNLIWNNATSPHLPTVELPVKVHEDHYAFSGLWNWTSVNIVSQSLDVPLTWTVFRQLRLFYHEQYYSVSLLWQHLETLHRVVRGRFNRMKNFRSTWGEPGKNLRRTEEIWGAHKEHLRMTLEQLEEHIRSTQGWL